MPNERHLSSVVCRPSSGWYLGLRYMQGRGLIAKVAEAIDASHHGAQFIFADGVLNHNAEWREVLNDWWDALAIGGYLILWLPDCRHADTANDAARFTLADITHALDHKRGWQLHESDLIDGHIYAVWQKRADEKQWHAPWRKQRQHVLIARTGAHGDALMAASILPWLKEQGWAISFITKRPGIEILRHDPHIDELIRIAEGQLKDEDMPYYWQAWERRFDRFINLTYSIEGELLKQPGRPDYFWPDDQRRAHCARSYLGNTHALANVPGPYRVRFYPAETEKKWAAAQMIEYRCQMSENKKNLTSDIRHPSSDIRHLTSVLWLLKGSSAHKWWPYAPQTICQLLARTDLHFILTGDAEAAPLAESILQAAREYHGDARRVSALVGTNTIREIMTLAHHAAVVVGPETGIMNAVSLEPVPKVLLLSHSAASNLSDDWMMTTALTPDAACYPCHRLHYSNEWCPQDESTGAASCAASIGVEKVVQAIISASRKKSPAPWWVREEMAFGRVA